MKLGSVVAAAAAAAAVGAGLLGPGGASAFILSPPLRKPFVASLRPLRSAAGELADIPEQQENDIFVFREFGTSKYIEVFADAMAKVEGREYLIGRPCDWAVTVGRPDGKGGLRPVALDSAEMDDLFGPLETMLEEDDIHLMRSAVTLTLQGEFLDDDEDYDDDDDDDDDEYEEDENEDYDWQADFEIIEEGDGEHFEDTEDDDDAVEDRQPTNVDDEDVDLIASFWHEKKEYCLVRMRNPVWLIAKKVAMKDGMEYYYLLDQEEAAKVNPVVESMMIKRSMQDDR